MNFTPQPTVVDNYIPINPATDEQRENLFRSFFAFVDPYLNGPSAVDEPLETGQPEGSRNLGEIGAFVNRFSLNSAPTYTPGKEYHFFTVEIKAVASGEVGFSGNVAEANKTLVFSLPTGGGGASTEVDPAHVGFYQDLNSPLVVRVVGVSPWQNNTSPCDVNDDGLVTPLDVITLINDINLHGARMLSLPALDAPPPYLDPDGNDEIGASDVLAVINHINARDSNGGEGEVSDIAPPNVVPDRFSLDSASGTATLCPLCLLWLILYPYHAANVLSET